MKEMRIIYTILYGKSQGYMRITYIKIDLRLIECAGVDRTELG
jgi:hypothetical protein